MADHQPEFTGRLKEYADGLSRPPATRQQQHRLREAAESELREADRKREEEKNSGRK